MNAASLMSSNVGFKQEAQSYAIDLLSNNDGVHANAATQCADGKYYRVACLAWTTTLDTKEGDIDCGGANSGSFTVTGLPLDSDITCLIRKSTDGSTFKPFASIELPSNGMSGTTDSISSSGDMNINVTANSDGSLTTTLVSGSNKADDNATSGSFDNAAMSGYYSMECDSSSVDCNCMLFADHISAYQSNINGAHAACVTDSASQIPAGTAMKMNMNIYKASVISDITDGSGNVMLPSGSTGYAVSVWGASCSGSTAATCSSDRSGGEGGNNMGGKLTWADSTVTTAVSWQSGSTTLCSTCGNSGGDVVVDFSAGNAIPANSATRATWLTWLQSVVNSADHSGAHGWTCTNYSGAVANGSAKNSAQCISNFISQVLENSNANLPRVRWDMNCSNTSCSDTPAAAMVNIEGIKFDVSGNVVTDGPTGASPRKRMVFEQFIPASTGGGSFKQNHSDRRFIPCKTGGTTDSENAVYNCPVTGTDGGLECFMREEMGIRFMPTTNASSYNVGFKKNFTITGGFYRGNITGTINSTNDPYTKCMNIYSKEVSGGEFIAKATKL